MLNVLITVDVEIWPNDWDLSQANFKDAFQRYIQGSTPQGNYGLPFQLRLLKEHQLKAVFLVEALFACEFGIQPLKDIVDLITGEGQQVELHLHSEWVGKMTHSLLPGRWGINLKDFTLDEQVFLIGKGMENLRQCGLNQVCAFRAGNFGADENTLRAVAKNGITYDTSYNPYLMGTTRNNPLLQPTYIHELYEFPLSFFEDWPDHFRQAQLGGACSFPEMSATMMQAWERNWHSFVLLSHGSELLNGANDRPDKIVVKRFEKLCRFLADNRDKLNTAWFSEFEPSALPLDIKSKPLSSHVFRTAHRYGEQIMRRMFA